MGDATRGPEADVATAAWATLSESDRSWMLQRAEKREVSADPKEALLLAWLQSRTFRRSAERKLWYVLPVIGDLQFLLDWRLVRARRRNLDTARRHGLIAER